MEETTNGARYGLNHMELYVRDFDVMKDFYAGTLGFVVTDEGGSGEERMVFLSKDPTVHHQLVLSSGRPQETGFNVLNHISFRIDSLATLKAMAEALGDAPERRLETANHGISWSIYFRDPEGNRLECFVDTPWYTPQPLRVPLELALPEEEIASATEALCRGRPGFMLRDEWLAEQARRHFPA